MKSEKARKIFVLILGIAAIAVVTAYLFGIYIEYTQIKEIGENFLQVFFTNMKTKIILQSVTFLLVFAILYLSLSSMKVSLLKLDSSYDFLKTKYVILVPSLILSLVISGIVQLSVYESLLKFMNPVFVGTGDPLFYKDIGYYLFQRPFLADLFDALFIVAVFITVIIALSYVFLCGRMGIGAWKDLIKTKRIVYHNITNVSAIVIIVAISCLFRMEEILYSENGGFFGAGYVDFNVRGFFYRILPVVLFASVIAMFLFASKNKARFSMMTLIVYPASYVIFVAVALFMQTFVVKPQEAAVEAPYIMNNIKYTQAAYNLDSVEKKEFPVSYELTPKKIQENSSVLSNIRIIDAANTVKAINQLQGIRNYYFFNDLDIVRYEVDGKNSAVAIAARELNRESLTGNNESFLNERLRFTHGYGVVAMRINQVTKEGQPSLLIKDIPPVCEDDFVKVRQPRIYFGELSDEYSVVNSGYKELDYFSGDKDIEFSYDGKAGIKMNLLNRLAYSLHYKDFQLLISGLVNSESRLIVNRNVTGRVKTAAPFLDVSKDPYMLIDKSGKLKWIVDCYTVSRDYPYAQPVKFHGKEINYVRNSVKAVVDAYDGTVEFYITDKNDPVVMSYNKIYPDFFSKNELPADLRSHVVYPEELFKIQAEMFKKYHVNDAGIFYNNSDNWDIAREKYQTEIKYLDPYYTFMSYGNEGEKLVLMIPYTMSEKDNLVAWLGVDNEYGSGKMILYTFPKGENVYGTMQIENRIDNDPGISKELTLWDQGGSSVIRGNMLVVPVHNSLVYIEPIYITTDEKASIPELKRVIVAYGDRIIMEPDLSTAFKKMFDVSIASPGAEEDKFEPVVTENNNELIVELFDNIKKSLSEGDWEGFGTGFRHLESEIEKLRKPSEETGQEEITE